MKFSAVLFVMLLVGIPLLFSSFTVLMVESWIKYPLIILESIAIIAIYWVLTNSDIGNSLEIISRILSSEKSLGLVLDLILVTSASVVLILNGFHTSIGSIFHLILAFICTSFLSGQALLNIFRLTTYFSKLEIMVLSFVGSFIFSAFVSLFLLPVDESVRIIIMPICYLALGIISSLRRIMSKRLDLGQNEMIVRPHSFSKNIDIFAIAFCIAFYVVFFSLVYPNAALLPGTDISRHYSYASILSRSPDLYDSAMSRYLLFHAFEAAVQVMTTIQQSVEQVLTILVVLNGFLSLSIYILAKRFLSDVDKRIPAISVIFYTILSNFSFVYYTQLKMLGTTASQIFSLVADKSQNGNINPLQPFPFFVPLSVSVILFAISFHLLKETNLSRSKFVLLFSTLILSMYLTHVAEAVIFTTFLGFYAFISRNKTLRIDDALVSSLFGLVTAAIFVASTSLWTAEQRYNPNFLNILSLFFPCLLVSTSLIWRRMILPKIGTLLDKKFVSKPIYYQILSVTLTLIYLFGFLTWFLIEDFNTASLYELGTVPWIMYPVLLGIAGLMAVISISYIRNVMPRSSIFLLLGSIGFMLLLGKLISFVSLNIIILDYWEKRLLGLLFIPVCLLAPIPLIGIRDRIETVRKNKKNLALLRNVFVLALISIIVFLGFSSMAIQFEYWFSTSDASKISEKELEAVNFLKSVFQNETRAYVITPSTASRDILAFAAPPYQFWRPELLTASINPDLPMVALDAPNLTHAYLYLHNRDLKILEKGQVGWLKHHLLPLLPAVFSNNEVTIYNVTSISFPLSNSNNTLIIPHDPHDDSWLYAYDVVSQSLANYTVIYDNDPNYKPKNAILSFDPKSSVSQKFSNGTSNKWDTIKGKWNFSSQGLVVEDNSDVLQNVALNPSRYTTKNLNISTSFKILKIDPQNPSYVSIVYSWLDPKNYESAGLTINSGGIFLNFAKVTDGRLSFQPSWPGIKTNLNLKPNDILNMSLHFNETSKSVTLSGTDSLLGNVIVTMQIPNVGNKKGYLGLSYGRIENMIFDGYTINETRDFPLDNYLRYVREGGNLVVLNTNGYGDIASSFFKNVLFSGADDNDIMPTLLSSDKEGKKSEALHTKLRELEELSKGSTRPTISASLMQELHIGQGTIKYINIHPLLVRFFENRSSGSDTYQMMGEISKIINLTRSRPTSNFNEISATFRNLTGNGNNIEVATKSVIFPSDTHLSNLTIRSGDKTIKLKNVSDLSISDYDHVLLNSNRTNSKIITTRGTGLYVGLTLSNSVDDQHHNNSSSYPESFSLKLRNSGTLSVSNYSSPKNTDIFYNVSNISIAIYNPLEVIVRQPAITITNGQLMLNRLYAESDELYRKLGLSPADLNVLGNMSISISMADSYILAKLNTSGAIMNRVPALPQPNELAPFFPNFNFNKIRLIPPLVLLISLLPFLIGIVFLFYSHTKIYE